MRALASSIGGLGFWGCRVEGSGLRNGVVGARRLWFGAWLLFQGLAGGWRVLGTVWGLSFHGFGFVEVLGSRYGFGV